LADGVYIDRLAFDDLCYIQNSGRFGRWYPALKTVIGNIALGPSIVYGTGPDGTMKFQPLRKWVAVGVPAYHIVWEEGLNGFRPMLLRFEDLIVVTGIAIERDHHRIDGMPPGKVDYDDPNDPQIKRMLRRFQELDSSE
jgi:hypothetical protein